MMLATLVGAVIMTSTQPVTSLPSGLNPNLQLNFAGTPAWVQNPASVRTQWHAVTMELESNELVVRSTTLFRNNSNLEVSGTIGVPIHTVGGLHDRSSIREVLWSDQPVSRSQTVNQRWGQAQNQVSTWHHYPVRLRPQGTHSLKVTYRLPVLENGFEGVERALAYFTAPIGQTENLETFQMSIRFGRNVVFQTIEASPREFQWQIGDRGAFLKREPFRLAEPRILVYRFYPADFQPIGIGD